MDRYRYEQYRAILQSEIDSFGQSRELHDEYVKSLIMIRDIFDGLFGED